MKVKIRRIDGIKQGYHVNPGEVVRPIVKSRKAKPVIKPTQSSKKLHIVAFSGGKDSSAMLLRMIELGMPIDKILFCDTGKEFPALYEYVHKMNQYTSSTIGVPVTWLKPKKTWDDWFFGKVTKGKAAGIVRGWPLLCFFCWWSRESKFKLMDPICLNNERYIGFGKDETKRVIAGRKKVGYNFPLADWGWTEADAVKYLEKRGWDIPLHHDFKRTGCFLCPYQRMESVITLCRKYPEQWKQLMSYAEKAPNEFKPGVGVAELRKIERMVAENKPSEEILAAIKKKAASGCDDGTEV